MSGVIIVIIRQLTELLTMSRWRHPSHKAWQNLTMLDILSHPGSLGPDQAKEIRSIKACARMPNTAI